MSQNFKRMKFLHASKIGLLFSQLAQDTRSGITGNEQKEKSDFHSDNSNEHTLIDDGDQNGEVRRASTTNANKNQHARHI